MRDQRDGEARQSGLPGFRVADLAEHERLLHMARQDAAVLLARDPKLETPRGRAMRARSEGTPSASLASDVQPRPAG